MTEIEVRLLPAEIERCISKKCWVYSSVPLSAQDIGLDLMLMILEIAR